MYSKRFEKETFKNDVKENVRTLYRKEIGLRHRKHTKKKIQRPYIICQWNFLWDVHLATT